MAKAFLTPITVPAGASGTQVPQKGEIDTLLSAKEATANKDATGGYAGLTLFKINFKNALNTITSFFTNANTVARTYTFPDKDGTVAMTSDITGTNSGTNTGDQTLPTLVSLGAQAALSNASTSVSGILTSTDWNTFNGKQAALGFTPYNATNPNGYTSNTGTVTGVTATSPVASSGGTAPVISMPAATSLVSGYLTNTDWATFNGKQAAGSYVTVGGALGTPSSGTLTNCTFPTLNQNTTGSSGSCTGNAATATTATTATNQSGGTVNATTGSFSGLLNVTTRLNLGTDGTAPYANPTGQSAGISFGGWEGSSTRQYGVFTESENVGGNYTKLAINWHTGIRIGAYYGYGGTRFFNNSWGTGGSGVQIFSVGDGDNNVRVANTIYATTFSGALSGNATTATTSASCSGNAATVTNGVYTTGSYANPTWITNINYSILNGTVPTWNQNTTGSSGSCTGNAATATTASALSSATWQRITGNTADYGSYGSIGVSGVTGGYAGVSFSGVSGTLMMTAAASGFYYSNTTWRVYWDGSGNQINTGNVTAYSSDERLKYNVANITNALDKVKAINGVTYDWDLEECNKWDFYPPKSDVGVLAQQIQKVCPEAVAFAPFDRDPLDEGKSKSGKEYLTVQYEKLVPLLIEAIKELTLKVEALERK